MALNKVIIQGNLVKDNEIKQTNNGGTYLRNTIACSRNYAKEGEERQSDFINIVSYGKISEFLEKYFKKGDQVLIEGRIQTGSYEKDGAKVYTTDVVVESVNFCGYKKQSEESSTNKMEVPSDEDLPF